MSGYYIEIQRVVNAALGDMATEHQRSKLIDAPAPNNQFLVRWVTKAIKSQQFQPCVGKNLKEWQGLGRSQGNFAALETVFRRISAYYAMFHGTGRNNTITDGNIEYFLDEMEKDGWEVTTSEPLVNQGKIQLLTEKRNSLALCAHQCTGCFDGEILVKPMSWFVRGDHSKFVESASQFGFMVHKNSDYKSNVKYHGEYLIYPQNAGMMLAEIPINFTP